VDRLFLDANVLFSAAYRTDAGVRRLWELPATVLVTSSYAAEEARRNLATAEQRAALDLLLATVQLSNRLADLAVYPAVATSGLPEKDLPILRTAVAAGCSHLITGDRQHFDHLFGAKVAGVLVLPPADYLARRGRGEQSPVAE
jgi:predicted nucleic acid-binding protein